MDKFLKKWCSPKRQKMWGKTHDHSNILSEGVYKTPEQGRWTLADPGTYAELRRNESELKAEVAVICIVEHQSKKAIQRKEMLRERGEEGGGEREKESTFA